MPSHTLRCFFCGRIISTEYLLWANQNTPKYSISPLHYAIHCADCQDEYKEWEKENAPKIQALVKKNNRKKYTKPFFISLIISIVLPLYKVAQELFKPNSFLWRLFVALNLLWWFILFLIFAAFFVNAIVYITK